MPSANPAEGDGPVPAGALGGGAVLGVGAWPVAMRALPAALEVACEAASGAPGPLVPGAGFGVDTVLDALTPVAV